MIATQPPGLQQSDYAFSTDTVLTALLAPRRHRKQPVRWTPNLIEIATWKSQNA